MDESSRQESRPPRDLRSGSGPLGVLSRLLEFLKFVVVDDAYTRNLLRVLAGTTSCLVLMIMVVAYAAPSLTALVALMAGVTGTATISITMTATLERRRRRQDDVTAGDN